MAKILLHISEQQHDKLKERAKKCGITVTEYIRRIFDLFLCKKQCKRISDNELTDCPLLNPQNENIGEE